MPMRRSRAHWRVEMDAPDRPLIIRDVGPWDRYPSVTNDVEAVVGELIDRCLLGPGRRLLYYDSEGILDEILVVNGHFAGFAPGPRPTTTRRPGDAGD